MWSDENPRSARHTWDCVLLLCHHISLPFFFPPDIDFPNTACQKSVPSMPCVHTCGLYWRGNNVAVHDPRAGTFHCVTPHRPPTQQQPLLPVWILRNVPVVPQTKPPLLPTSVPQTFLFRKKSSQPARNPTNCGIMLLFFSLHFCLGGMCCFSSGVLVFWFALFFVLFVLVLNGYNMASAPSYFWSLLCSDQSLFTTVSCLLCRGSRSFLKTSDKSPRWITFSQFDS